ncbi:MAG: aminotransferase [Proteobacteria bacterium]|nr:aminotransferase [Pseudomonadota bacterium]
MTLDLRRHFSRFIAANPGRIHLGAHSHHYWPDVTFAAQQRYWEDAAAFADHKWDLILGEVGPRVQEGIAARLRLPDRATIAFAPNTHDLLCRILSCFPAGGRLRILTSDAEFHSFSRQVARLEEEDLAVVERVASQPCDSFAARFLDRARAFSGDLVFVSQVFFDSGAISVAPQALAEAVGDPSCFIVVDGYHGYMALPLDLAPIAERVFYLAGGYKYAMAGEGACFLHCPPGYGARPRDTGWFAAFGALAGGAGAGVGYARDGGRFFGATFDASALYRMRAVNAWMDAIGLTVEAIHAHVLERLSGLAAADLVTPVGPRIDRGHFLTFAHVDAQENERRLADAGIVCDRRGERLRFGFGCYHVAADIDAATAAIAAALR